MNGPYWRNAVGDREQGGFGRVMRTETMLGWGKEIGLNLSLTPYSSPTIRSHSMSDKDDDYRMANIYAPDDAVAKECLKYTFYAVIALETA